MKVVERYSSYKKELKRNNDERLKNEVRNAVLKLHKEGIYASQVALIKILPSPNCLRNPVLREIWKKEIELFY